MADVRQRAIISHSRVSSNGRSDILGSHRSLVYREEALVLRHGTKLKFDVAGRTVTSRSA